MFCFDKNVVYFVVEVPAEDTVEVGRKLSEQNIEAKVHRDV